MSRLIKPRVFLLLVALAPPLSLPALSAASDETPTCNVCFDQGIKKLKAELELLENHFLRYRWLQTRIRRLYYEELWRVRTEEQDPLVKSKREEATREEERLKTVLGDLESGSEDAANGLQNEIKRLLQGDEFFYPCCVEAPFRDCVASGLQPLYQSVAQFSRDFEHIFEHEREYQKAVALTAGGRQGLYPQDSLEKKEGHDEYFTRFESDRNFSRFQEDASVTDFLLKAQRQISEIKQSPCCSSCGRGPQARTSDNEKDR